MRLSDLPWGQIAKFTAAGLGAVGLFGTGYLTAPKTPAPVESTVKHKSQEIVIEVPLTIILDKEEITKKAKAK